MPTFRIVYIDDDTFAPRTLTAAFPDRAAAEVAMAKHGHRVVHVTELRAGENAGDPVRIALTAKADRDAAGLDAHRPEAARTLLGLRHYDLAGVAVAAVGIAVAGAAFLLF